jgi:hypothetical protein
MELLFAIETHLCFAGMAVLPGIEGGDIDHIDYSKHEVR